MPYERRPRYATGPAASARVAGAPRRRDGRDERRCSRRNHQAPPWAYAAVGATRPAERCQRPAEPRRPEHDQRPVHAGDRGPSARRGEQHGEHRAGERLEDTAVRAEVGAIDTAPTGCSSLHAESARPAPASSPTATTRCRGREKTTADEREQRPARRDRTAPRRQATTCARAGSRLRRSRSRCWWR